MKSRVLRMLAVISAALVTAWASLFYVFEIYLPTFNTPHTAIEGVPLRRSEVPPGPAISRRLWVVVVDGLGHQLARDLPELEPLRSRGVYRPLVADFPTFTSPGIVSMMTGLPPRDHGLRLNGSTEGVVGLDTIVHSAFDGGREVAVRPRAYPVFDELLRPPPGVSRLPGRWALCCELASERALEPFDARPEPKSELRLFHIDEVDHEGHHWGAESEEYRHAAVHAGQFLGRLVGELDLEHDTLIALSDHGHRPYGGHGGDEWDVSHAFFLAVGAGIRVGVELEARAMRDVTSTLSVLAGVPTPAGNIGQPMIDVLDLETSARARALAEPADQASGTLCALSPGPECQASEGLVERLRAFDASAVGPATAHLEALRSRRESELEAERTHDERWRVGVALAGVLVLAGLVGHRLRRAPRALRAGDVARWWTRGLGVALFATYIATLRAQGYHPSFSGMRRVEIFLPDAVVACLVSLAALMLLAWIGGGLAPRGRAGSLPYWILLVVAVPFALLTAWAGADPAVLPSPVAGVLVFQLGPLVISAALSAVLVAAWQTRTPKRSLPVETVRSGDATPVEQS